MKFPIIIFDGDQSIEIKDKATFSTFSVDYELILAAGGIVTNDNGEFLMIYRRGQWDFPKGKAEVNESPETTAIREVMEETGVDNLLILKLLPSTFHIYNENGKKILKRTDWFYMQSWDNMPLEPQTEEDITIAKWMPKKEADVLLLESYASLRNLWENLQELL